MCNVNLTVKEAPEDMAETCLFTLSAEQLISESVKTMAVWALPLEEKIEMEKNDPSYMGYRMWVVVDDWADHPFMPNHPITSSTLEGHGPRQQCRGEELGFHR